MRIRHTRTQSEMSFADLNKYEKAAVDDAEGEDMQSGGGQSMAAGQRRKMVRIIMFLIFAEAIHASGLHPQLSLLKHGDGMCNDQSAAYLQNLLESLYAFGTIAGVFWGQLVDRKGRRRVALMAMFGMTICSLCMGFVTNVYGAIFSQLLAGILGSSAIVTALTILGDVCPSIQQRAGILTCVPIAAFIFGLWGDFLYMNLSLGDATSGTFPLLATQLCCSGVIGAFSLYTYFTIEETLPGFDMPELQKSLEPTTDSERATFLGQIPEDEAPSTPTITVIDQAEPTHISIAQLLHAPALLTLLVSFCLLSFHSSTYDALLLQLGHSPASQLGMGIPCHLLDSVLIALRFHAGFFLTIFLPFMVRHFTLLSPYRLLSLLLPALYAATPVLAFFGPHLTPSVENDDAFEFLKALVLPASFGYLLKTIVVISAQLLVMILVLNASPDAYSSGTIVGLFQAALALFKGITLVVTGASFHLAGEKHTAGEVEVVRTNTTLWVVLFLVSALGAAAAWRVRDHPTVDQDYPAEVLRWELAFDADAEMISEEGVEEYKDKEADVMPVEKEIDQQ